jgi:CHAT domain-containing protein
MAQTLGPTSQQLYDAGRYAEAAARLEQDIQTYGQQGDRRRQAIALSNLALVRQRLGSLNLAQTAIEASLDLLRSPMDEPPTRPLAQALTIQGSIQLAQGQLNAAYDTWGQAADLYQRLGDSTGITQSRINQAQALKDLGFYRRAVVLLQDQVDQLITQPPSQTTTLALRSLGETLQLLGQFVPAIQTLEASLALATDLNHPDAIADGHLSLGHALRARAAQQRQLQQTSTPGAGDPSDTLDRAQQAYAAALDWAPRPEQRVAARSSQLSLFVERQAWDAALDLWARLQPDLVGLPITRATLYQRVEIAQTLMALRRGLGNPGQPSPLTLADLLTDTYRQAQALGDRRAEVYALGTLGALYEQTQQWSSALTLTQDALRRTQALQAPEVTYRWQWQLGRILKQQQDRPGAIAAYETAIATLQDLRADVVSINNPDAWLSFRDSIEPVYREFVALLLDPEGQPGPSELETARQTIEALQLAELDNFFRAACLDSNDVAIEDIDPHAAVVYPILLSDRLDVILSIPDQPLVLRSMPIDAATVTLTVQNLRAVVLTDVAGIRTRPLAARLYDWLIRPLESDLEQPGLDTLVFVLDGPLRNLPMAMLYDGQQYLVERYRTALAPGLQLIAPQGPRSRQTRLLMAGMSEVPATSPFADRFTDLPFVEAELRALQDQVPSRVLLNANFTADALQAAVKTVSAPIVHLATHGQFSSDLDNTFVLTWDTAINVLQLRDLLEVSDLRRRVPIDLLVFSACATAQGDDRAALGLAGVAVQAGARSTIGTLWPVLDASTADFMQTFYRILLDDNQPKAEALRQAQIAFIRGSAYNAPYYWAPFILVGNWL